MVYCAKEVPDPLNATWKRVLGGFEELDPFTPIYFHDSEYRQRRHELIQDIV